MTGQRIFTTLLVHVLISGFLITCQASGNTPSSSASSSSAETLFASATDSPTASPNSVGLVTFTGIVKNGVVTVKWQTAAELNCHGFDVEKKTGVMGTFAKIAFVQGHGTTNAAHSYQFIDIPTTPDSYSYRLREISTDGRSAYTTEVVVNVKVAASSGTLGATEASVTITIASR
jgi:hypothetical protein